MSTAWLARAACRGVDPAVFYLDRGVNATAAKATCAGCPVTAECLADADGFGIRAGLSPVERGRTGGSSPPRRKHGSEGGYQAHGRRQERPCRDCLDAHHSYTARRGIAS